MTARKSFAVWKYAIDLNVNPGDNACYHFKVPQGAMFIKVDRQANLSTLADDYICLWAQVDPEAPEETLAFRAVVTGEVVTPGPDETLAYLGTALMRDGIVVHIYQRYAK